MILKIRILKIVLKFWLQKKSTSTLELVRIGIGSFLFISYLTIAPNVLIFYSDAGLFTADVIVNEFNNPLIQSVFFYFTAKWQIVLGYSVFLIACLMLALGWRTNWFKWIVLIGHLSLTHRNPAISYGVDHVLASVLLIFCVAPLGLNMSLDRVRNVRRYKGNGLKSILPPVTSRWAFACTRLLQIQIALLFFYSGISKFKSADWWSGDAFWIAALNYQTNFVPLQLFAHQYWLVNIISFYTILIELAYIFLIWGRKTRSGMLIAAITLHLGFALILGLHYFAGVMIFVHLSFLRHEWLKSWGQQWKTYVGNFVVVYDGNCGFCKRSLQVLLAFDGLHQIEIRDYHMESTNNVKKEEAENALVLVVNERINYFGFDAYRYLVSRVPGLMWLIPLFHIPIISSLFGRPIYAWVAKNRSKLSKIITYN